MAFDPQTGPPLATAAHARARTARMFARLRQSILLKLTLITGGLALITGAPILLGRDPLPLFGAFRIAFSIIACLLLLRVAQYLTTETLWLLRNRLILAYVFMGVVPVVLIAGMLAIAAYMFYGQYAAFLLVSSLNERTRNVDAVSRLTVQDLDRHPDRASEAPGMSQYYASYYFPRGYGGVRTFFYESNGTPANEGSRRLSSPPAWMKEGFRGLVAMPNGYAIASYDVSRNQERVLTLYSLNDRTVEGLVPDLGQVSLMGWSGLRPTAVAPAPRLVAATPAPDPQSWLDIHITSWAFLPVTDWTTGQEGSVLTTIDTRPSALNNLLFSSLPSTNGQVQGEWPLLLLATIAVGFLIIEAFSLVAGIRLTRTITGAVNDLYVGTEHVNRGDFDHRIPVRTRDQLAALEISFNNMTASIGRLLKEQRQKQRLENELTIAHEVQAQLFPHTPPKAAGLEIAGRCLPARVVSGDFFDFLQLSPTRLSVTLGDVSGKGISAALLMATIVAAVRAFQTTGMDMLARVAGVGEGSVERITALTDGAPGQILTRLNLQLYLSTPPEKYATLFFAMFDSERRELRYTNAGHLPPAVIGARGIRRLDRGGVVAGLFEQASYEVGTVEMEPGDLLAAWSDGITEPENEYGVEFGEARLLQLLEQHRAQPIPDIVEAVLAAVKDWSGVQDQADDITLVLARLA